MRKHINVSDLRVGMQVVNPHLDWTKYPSLYAQDVLITSQEQIDEIISAGYQEVVIDLVRSSGSLLTDEMPSFDASKEVASTQVPLEEELPKALEVHDSCIKYARKFMEEARMGKVDVLSASPYVDMLLASLDRNPDALVSLSRLNQPDEYTYSHCINVAILAAAFAKFLGHDYDTVRLLCFAGMYHDLGKALTPLQVLNAPRRLTEEEFVIMKQHVVKGFEKLQHSEGASKEVLDAVMEHHEKYDGSGYPGGLIGEQVSLAGRIVGIVDTYDALTSDRVYKDGMFPHKALGIIYQMRDKDFQSRYVDEFVRMIGIYPVGSVVVLEDGSKAVVVRSNHEKALEPLVIVAAEPDGKPASRMVDLAVEKGVAIERGIPVADSGVSPLKVLGVTMG